MIHIDQEPDYVPKRLISRSAAIVALTIIISVVATIAVAGRVVDTMRVAAEPPARFEATPFGFPTEAELLRLRSERRLQSYGWVNRQAGIVHVPLEVAIDQYLGASR